MLDDTGSCTESLKKQIQKNLADVANVVDDHSRKPIVVDNTPDKPTVVEEEWCKPGMDTPTAEPTETEIPV